MGIPERASRFLAGTGKAVMPKVKLYEAARELHRLQIALEHGCKSWGEYAEMRQRENDKFFVKILGCKS